MQYYTGKREYHCGVLRWLKRNNRMKIKEDTALRYGALS